MTTREFSRVRQAVLLGLFAGTGVGLGYLLASVAGVELMTTNAALAGVALGPLGGLAVGILSQLVYSLGSPFGPPVPLLLIAQLVGMGLAGLLGGLLAPALRRRRSVTGAVLSGACGLLVALLFDLATNVVASALFGLSLRATLLAGAGVMALHLGVVTTAWAVLLPLLTPRLARLRDPGPRAVVVLALAGLGVAGPAAAQVPVMPDSLQAEARVSLVDSLATSPGDSLVAAVDSTATVAPDSLAVPPPSRPDLPEGWTLPLWEPFHATLEENLLRGTAWLPVRDGGAGSAAVIMGEAGTSPSPEFRRDGVPLGVGHRFMDDPESWSLAGRTLQTSSRGLAGGGAMHGLVELQRYDPVPDRDLLDSYWYAGPHETRLRHIQFLTADAPWRGGLDFYEHSDRFGYDFRLPSEVRYPELEDEGDPINGWGNAAVRAGRGHLTRTLDDGTRVSLSLENTRKHRRGMMAYGVEQQELWRTEATLRWERGANRAAVWWTDSDLLLDYEDSSDPDRLLEGAREGVTAHWEPALLPVAVDATYLRWAVRDTGFAVDWAPDHQGPVDLRGEQIDLDATTSTELVGLPTVLTVGSWWAEHGGLALGGKVRLGADDLAPGWQVSLERGGRAPRSDELATPWRTRVTSGRHTVMLPNRDLERESHWRVAAGWRGQALGWDLGLNASRRWLRHGIGWQASADQSETGQWQNGVELDATTVGAFLQREGRCWGWGRIRADVAWNDHSQADQLVVALPPAVDVRLAAEWEHRFFKEDGITQLGAYLHNRGAMDDPWALSRPVDVPALTVLDLILGFRLVGTNLSAEVCNVLGAGEQLSGSGVNEGRELRWRVHWVFHH